MRRRASARSTCAREPGSRRSRSAAITSATAGRARRTCPGIAAFGAAAELAARTLAAESERLGGLRDRLENAVLDRIPATGINGSRWHRVPNTSNLYFDGIDGEAMVIALDLRGFAVSTGAACSSRRDRAVARADRHRASRATARAPACAFRSGASNTAEQVDALVGGDRGFRRAPAQNLGACLRLPSPSR